MQYGDFFSFDGGGRLWNLSASEFIISFCFCWFFTKVNLPRKIAQVYLKNKTKQSLPILNTNQLMTEEHEAISAGGDPAAERGLEARSASKDSPSLYGNWLHWGWGRSEERGWRKVIRRVWN